MSRMFMPTRGNHIRLMSGINQTLHGYIHIRRVKLYRQAGKIVRPGRQYEFKKIKDDHRQRLGKSRKIQTSASYPQGTVECLFYLWKCLCKFLFVEIYLFLQIFFICLFLLHLLLYTFLYLFSSYCISSYIFFFIFIFSFYFLYSYTF